MNGSGGGLGITRAGAAPDRPGKRVAVLYLGETYLTALGSCGFLPLPGQFRDGAMRPWPEVNAERAAAGIILPGDFLNNNHPRPHSLRAVLDEDAPYLFLAFDHGDSRPLHEWATLGPMHDPRIGNHRLDRVADLSRLVLSLWRWYQENSDNPLSGLVHGDQPASLGPVRVELGVRQWITRVRYESRAQEPGYQDPLSVYGRLMILGALLQAKARNLCMASPERPTLMALARVSQLSGHPVTWQPARMEDLDAIPAELLRCTGTLSTPAAQARALTPRARDAKDDLDEAEAAALAKLCERDIWLANELPDGIGAPMLRCLDYLECIEVRSCYRQGDGTKQTLPWRRPSTLTPDHGDYSWDTILARHRLVPVEKEPPQEVRVNDRGRAMLDRWKRRNTRGVTAGPHKDHSGPDALSGELSGSPTAQAFGPSNVRATVWRERATALGCPGPATSSEWGIMAWLLREMIVAHDARQWPRVDDPRVLLLDEVGGAQIAGPPAGGGQHDAQSQRESC